MIEYGLKYRLLKTLASIAGKVGKGMGLTLQKPIFIVGTGRCGTSLLVRLLQSHKKIAVFPSEANELWHPKSYPYSEARLEIPPILMNPKVFTEISLNNWPNNHEDSIEKIFVGFHLLIGTSKAFVLKSAMIAFMIEPILRIFPGAKFIHIYRNGVSVVESLFKKEWPKYRSMLANEQDFRFCCAEYWSNCITEIDRVDESLSLKKRNALYELSYEDLCNEPRGHLDNLANFMGCEVEGFNFDLSRIKSTNYKVGDYTRDEKWFEIVEAMYPTMKRKGYDMVLS